MISCGDYKSPIYKCKSLSLALAFQAMFECISLLNTINYDLQHIDLMKKINIYQEVDVCGVCLLGSRIMTHIR